MKNSSSFEFFDRTNPLPPPSIFVKIENPSFLIPSVASVFSSSLRINFLLECSSNQHSYPPHASFHSLQRSHTRDSRAISDRERDSDGESGGGGWRGRGGEDGSSSDAVARVGVGHSGRRAQVSVARADERDWRGSRARWLEAERSGWRRRASLRAARDQLAQTRPPLADPRGAKTWPTTPSQARQDDAHGLGSVYAIRYTRS